MVQLTDTPSVIPPASEGSEVKIRKCFKKVFYQNKCTGPCGPQLLGQVSSLVQGGTTD